MQKKKQNKGISLIVLVITIVIMIILATTIIISLSNNGIISKANEAVLKTNLTTLQEKVSMYFADNYDSIDMSKEYTITEFGITDEEFEEYVDISIVLAGKVYIRQNAPEDIQQVARQLNMLIEGALSNTENVTLEKTATNLRIYGNSTTDNMTYVGDITENLLNGEDWSDETTYSGVTVQYLAEEECFLLNGTATGTVDIASKTINIPTEIGKPYTLATCCISGSVTGDAMVYISKNNTPSTVTNWFTANLENGKHQNTKICDANYITKMWFYLVEGTVFNNYKVKISIEQSATATDWNEFGKYKIPIIMNGKNFLNVESDFTFTQSKTLSNVNIPSGKYRIVCDTPYQNDVEKIHVIVMRLQDSKGNKICYLTKNYNKEIELTEDITEINFYANGYDYNASAGYTGKVTNLMIIDADDDTSYEPYIKRICNIYLTEPLRKVGNTADYIDLEKGEVVRYITKNSTTGELEVLTTPKKEKVNIENFDFTSIKYIKVKTLLTPSVVDVRY